MITIVMITINSKQLNKNDFSYDKKEIINFYKTLNF